MDWPQFDYSKFLFEHGFRIASIIAGAYILFQLLGFFKRRAVSILAKRQGADKSRGQRIATVSNVIRNSGVFLIVLTAIIMILQELGMDTSPVLASAGVVGLAVSLGSQALMKDFFGGMIILVENQYSEGDAVRVGGVEGEVTCLSLRKTIIRDKQGVLHHVPNGQVVIVGVLPIKKK